MTRLLLIVFLPPPVCLGIFFPAMNFTLLDWSAIVAYLGITLLLGLYFRRRSGKSVDDYFVSGRKCPGGWRAPRWWPPLLPPILLWWSLVWSIRQGIAGNWLWWAFLLSGHDDGVSVRPPVAAFRTAHRRAVRRDALLREAGGFPARLSRHLPRAADELPDSGLGHQGHDQHRGDPRWA